MAQNLPDPSPYADKAATSAESEGGKEQVGDPNTKRSTKGESISLTGGGRDDSRQGVPYANTSGNCATDESGKGL